MLTVVFVFLLITFIYFGVPWFHKKLAQISIGQKAREQNALVLTFDDGPGTLLTGAVLDILARSNAKATFFILGRNIQGREAIIRQISEHGHEICSHGYEHCNYWEISPFRALSDIRRGWETINKVLGLQQKTYPFRPPQGKMNIICLLFLLIKRVPIVYWSVDAGDTWKVKPDSRRLATLLEETGGMVCLVHDFDRTTENVSGLVLDSVSSALSVAEKKGMQVLTFSQLQRAGR